MVDVVNWYVTLRAIFFEHFLSSRRIDDDFMSLFFQLADRFDDGFDWFADDIGAFETVVFRDDPVEVEGVGFFCYLLSYKNYLINSSFFLRDQPFISASRLRADDLPGYFWEYTTFSACFALV